MTQPRFSVCEFTTMKQSFAEDLELFSKAGADGIGIFEAKLGDDKQDLARLAASGLKVGQCFPEHSSILPLPFFPGPNDPADRVAEIIRGIRRLAPFEPSACVIITGPQGTYGAEEAHEIAVSGLKQVARAAADVGVTVTLEAIHASIRDDWTLVASMPELVEMLDEIDEPNTGIAFDVWHLWDTPDLLRHMREHADRIQGVHIDDWREPTRSWCDRVLPGDGVADLRGIFAALDDGGFDGWFDFEIFSDDGMFGNDFPDSLWKRDPLELIRAGREQFMNLWETRRA